MLSQVLPVSNRLQSSAMEPPSSASVATMLLKAEIQDDPSTSIIVSSRFEDEEAVTIRPLLTRASSYNNRIPNSTSIGPGNQQRRRWIASDSSLALLAGTSPRGSFRQDVGHAAAETFLVTRLSLKLLRYLGFVVPFSAQITVVLSLLLTAFTPLIQNPALPPHWHSVMLSIYCVMMMMCAVTLLAIVSLRGEEEEEESKMLHTIALLTGSLAVISLLSINQPYIASFWLLVWLIFAAHRIRNLIRDLNRPLLPLTSDAGSNSNYFTTIIEKIKKFGQ